MPSRRTLIPTLLATSILTLVPATPAEAGVALEFGSYAKPAGATTLGKEGDMFLVNPKAAGGAWTLYWGRDGAWQVKVSGVGAQPLRCDIEQLTGRVITKPADVGTYSCVSSTATAVAVCGTGSTPCTVAGSGTMYYGAGPAHFTSVALKGPSASLRKVECSPTSLGVADPLYGTEKACFFLPAPPPPYWLVSHVNALPKGLTACGRDGDRCRTPAGLNTTIFYGHGTNFAKLNGYAGDFTCLPGSLGVEDPVPNVTKSCYVSFSLERTGYIPCGFDGDKCAPLGPDTPGRWTGYYGAGSTFVPIAGDGPFTCLNSALGVEDPVPNVRKTCYARPEPAPVAAPALPLPFSPPGSKCADEGGSCSFKGPSIGSLFEAYYGVGDKWVKKDMYPDLIRVGNVLTGYEIVPKLTYFNCGIATFGTDPAPGQRKVCYVHDTGYSGEY